jgi:hypothetical protein
MSLADTSMSYVVGHSETGHHHVLEAETPFQVWTLDDEVFLLLVESGTLTHQKDHDKHPDLPVAAGAYRVVRKTEYDPLEQVIQEVRD